MDRKSAFKPTLDGSEKKESRATTALDRGKKKKEMRLQQIRAHNLAHINNQPVPAIELQQGTATAPTATAPDQISADTAFFANKSQEIQDSVSNSISYVENGAVYRDPLDSSNSGGNPMLSDEE